MALAGSSCARANAKSTRRTPGALAQVYVLIIGGQVFPLELFPGYSVTSTFYDGVIAHYTPSLAELALGMGGMGLAVLVTLIGVRILPFVPVQMAGENQD